MYYSEPENCSHHAFIQLCNQFLVNSSVLSVRIFYILSTIHFESKMTSDKAGKGLILSPTTHCPIILQIQLRMEQQDFKDRDCSVLWRWIEKMGLVRLRSISSYQIPGNPGINLFHLETNLYFFIILFSPIMTMQWNNAIITHHLVLVTVAVEIQIYLCIHAFLLIYEMVGSKWEIVL